MDRQGQRPQPRQVCHPYEVRDVLDRLLATSIAALCSFRAVPQGQVAHSLRSDIDTIIHARLPSFFLNLSHDLRVLVLTLFLHHCSFLVYLRYEILLDSERVSIYKLGKLFVTPPLCFRTNC